MKTLATIILAVMSGFPGQQERAGQLEPARSMAEMKKASEPGDDHRQIDGLAGIWDVTIKYKLGGQEREGTATCDAMWVLGGRALKQEYRTSVSGTPFLLVQYLGYDIPKKRFFVTKMDSLDSGVMNTEGISSEDGKVFTLVGMRTDPVTGKVTRLRTVTTIIDRDHYIVEWFQKLDGRKDEERIVTLSHTRNEQ